MDAKEMGRRGGNERAKRLTPERRLEIAKQGGQASKAARKKKQQRPKPKNHTISGGK
jgi:general stress protein YciG